MSIPLTTRLSEMTVAALDEAVEAGLAPSKGAIVAEAVKLWLDRHNEESIAASYREAYAEPDPGHDELIDRLGTYSVGACLLDG